MEKWSSLPLLFCLYLRLSFQFGHSPALVCFGISVIMLGVIAEGGPLSHFVPPHCETSLHSFVKHVIVISCHKLSLYLKHFVYSSLLQNRCAHKQSTWQRSLLQEYDKGLAHTHARSHSYSLVDFFFYCLQFAKEQRLWTDMQQRQTYRQRPDGQSPAGSEWDRCVWHFDLRESTWGEDLGKGRGLWSVSILENAKCVAGSRVCKVVGK